MTLLRLSMTGGVMILFIALLRHFMLNRLPKKTFVLLWEAAVLRLVIPFELPAKCSIYNLFVRPKPISVHPAATGIPTTGHNIWQGIWLIGVLLFTLVFLAAYGLCLLKLRHAANSCDETARQWLAHQSLHRSIRLQTMDGIRSPLTYGILHPVIVLPAHLTQPVQLLFALQHEMVHIRRMDILRKLVVAAVLCVHWFNPAVWLLWVLLNRDMEALCDERVIQGASGDVRAAYAYALLDMAEQHPAVSLTYFSSHILEERIRAIMNTKQLTALTAITSSVLVIGIVSVLGTSAAAAASPLQPMPAAASPVQPPADSAASPEASSILSPVYYSFHGEATAPHTRYDWDEIRRHPEENGIVVCGEEWYGEGKYQLPPEYPVNENGQTYGASGNVQMKDQPALVSVIGDHEVEGYCYTVDLLSWGNEPANPEEAVARQEAWFAAGKPHTILTVYASDGITVLDTFTCGGN